MRVILGWEALQFSTHDHLSEAKNRPPLVHFEPFGNLHFSIMIYFMSDIDFSGFATDFNKFCSIFTDIHS